MFSRLHLKKPSEIRFSQDSVANHWKGNYSPIGNTLDQLLLGEITVENIPTITVQNKNGNVFTSDNRRLWVFKKLEELGKCETIPIQFGYIHPKKFTTLDNGHSISIRGDPGGYVWKTWKKDPVSSMSAVKKNTADRQPEYMPSHASCKQDTLDLSTLSLAINDSKTESKIEVNIRAEDIGFFQDGFKSNQSFIGEILDLWLSKDLSKYCWDLEVFEKDTQYYTPECTKLWVLRNLEKFGRSPEIRITIIEKPIQQYGKSLTGFFRDSLEFTTNSPIGGKVWKSIDFLKSLPTIDLIRTSVSEIFFTTSSISDTLENKSIAKVVAECNATLKIPRRPRVVKFRERYYTLDNEILWVLKEVQKVQGPLNVCIEVKIEMDQTLFNSFASGDIREVELRLSSFSHTNEEAFILQYIQKMST